MKKLIACLLSLMMVFALCASAFADEGELVIYNAVYEEEGDGLCARFGIGRTALYAFARQNYGMGVAQHVRALRVEHARKLLVTRPELNISQIAEACGFRDYNYFITIFGRLAGTSPRQYRLEHLKGE